MRSGVGLLAVLLVVAAVGVLAAGCGSGSAVPRADAGGTGGRDGGMLPPGCANVGCGAPPLCSVGCQERCGCCPCTESLVVGDPDAGQLRCSGGCWLPFISPVPVPDGGGAADANRPDVRSRRRMPPPGTGPGRR